MACKVTLYKEYYRRQRLVMQGKSKEDLPRSRSAESRELCCVDTLREAELSGGRFCHWEIKAGWVEHFQDMKAG